MIQISKKLFIKLTGFFLLFIFVSRCSSDNTPLQSSSDSAPLKLSHDQREIIEADRNFSFRLFKTIVRSEDVDKNIFISPLSVSFALGMTMNGADGETYEAIQNCLQLQNLSEDQINHAYHDLINELTVLDDKVRFDIANSIWYRQGFSILPTFLEKNQKYFNAEINPAAFDEGTVKRINDWVADKTQGKINQIIDRIDRAAVLFLLNAIYFKADWRYQFDEEKTRDDHFTTPDNRRVTCKMMSVSENFGYFEDEQLQAVSLPYGNSSYGITIFLPRAEKELSQLINKFDGQQWEYYQSGLSKDTVVLNMPRFKLEYELKMNDVLSGLGMAVAFNPEQADFSRINKDRELFLSQVRHKTFVQVDEKGTEAAAVTIVETRTTSVDDSEIKYVQLNRPFFFVIHERSSDAILFMGKIVEPVWN